mgnify:CR=1 FL=1|tara:strand:+ start:101 stop:346 length:246 start_codon:yes stop_codon:yes gene_type:complete
MDTGTRLFIVKWLENDLRPLLKDQEWMDAHLHVLVVGMQKAKQISDKDKRAAKMREACSIFVASVVYDAAGVDIANKFQEN